MTFNLHDHSIVHASGRIEYGDAIRFAALPKFDTLELDSPGGLVGEALTMAANMDARGGIRTIVKPGESCASACAMALFVSGNIRIIYMGGRLGIHSCAMPDGNQAPECNRIMASNATNHGVPWGVIEGFGNYTKPSSMLWLSAEDAECWGLMKWSAQDTSNNGIACFKRALLESNKRKPDGVTAENADDILCRMNARTSLTYVPSGQQQQGFSDTYRSSCERIVANPSLPKYAAIDIILWLTLSDPKVLSMKPGTLVLRILHGDSGQVSNCWKCLTIMGMSKAMHGFSREALDDLHNAVTVVSRDTGSVPAWLTSRVEVIGLDAAKAAH